MTEINLTKREEKDLLLKALFGSPFFNIFASVLATFIVGAVFFKYGGGVPINVTSSTTEKLSTFDVSGAGTEVVVPDEARVSMGVRKEGRTVAEVQEAVNSTMAKLSDQLKELGIDKDDIKTTSYSFNPNYRVESGPNGYEGYMAYAQITVKIRDLENVSPVLDLVGQLGLERVSGVTFGLSDELEKETINNAREKAVEEAKNKAKTLAKLADMKLGRIVNVQENNRFPQPFYARNESAVMLDSKGEEPPTPTPVEPGSSEVSVNVTLSYETL